MEDKTEHFKATCITNLDSGWALTQRSSVNSDKLILATGCQVLRKVTINYDPNRSVIY